MPDFRTYPYPPQPVAPIVTDARTPPFVQPGMEATTPPIAPPQQPRASNPAARLLQMLSDPRSTGFLLSMAQGLAQPRYAGQTGVSNVLSALSQGYHSLALADALRYQRQQQAREEARAQGTYERQGRESAANIAATTAGVPAKIAQAGNIKADTKLTEARTAAIPEETKMRQRELDLRKSALENEFKRTDLDALNVELRRQQMDTEAQQWKDKLDLENRQLQALIASRADEASIARQKIKVEEADNKSRQALYGAQAAHFRAEAEKAIREGDMPKYGAAAMNQVTRILADDTRMINGTPQEREQAVQDAQRAVGSSLEALFGKDALKGMSGLESGSGATKKQTTPAKRGDKAHAYGKDYTFDGTRWIRED